MRAYLQRWKEERVGKIELALNTQIIWFFLVLMAVADIAGLKMEGISVVPLALWSNISTLAAIVVICGIYTYVRRDRRIAEMTHMMAVLLFFTIVGVIASYIAAAFQRPLIDSYLVAADHALGFDWLASYQWVKAHPHIHKLLYVAYASLSMQLLLLIIIFNFKGRCERGWEMIWLFMVSCILCIFFSVLWPAVGAFGYYHVEANIPYVRIFMALHDGTLKIIGDKPIEGIIQFPSFHAALCIFFPYVARGMKILFITLLEINILMFLATVDVGGHHLSDVIAGILLALLTILIVKKASAAKIFPEIEKSQIT